MTHPLLHHIRGAQCPAHINQKSLNESTFSCLPVYNHTKICQANLVSLQCMVFFTIRSVYPKKCKHRTTTEHFENTGSSCKKKPSDKTLKMPLDTPNSVNNTATTICLSPDAWEQRGDRQKHLEVGMHRPVSPRRAP